MSNGLQVDARKLWAVENQQKIGVLPVKAAARRRFYRNRLHDRGAEGVHCLATFQKSGTAATVLSYQPKRQLK
jgi:hypothetical protein